VVDKIQRDVSGGAQDAGREGAAPEPRRVVSTVISGGRRPRDVRQPRDHASRAAGRRPHVSARSKAHDAYYGGAGDRTVGCSVSRPHEPQRQVDQRVALGAYSRFYFETRRLVKIPRDAVSALRFALRDVIKAL
jgi:hypothetical protein